MKPTSFCVTLQPQSFKDLNSPSPQKGVSGEDQRGGGLVRRGVTTENASALWTSLDNVCMRSYSILRMLTST